MPDYIFEWENQKAYLKQYTGREEVVEIPQRWMDQEVAGILPYAFQECRQIRQIRIPASVRQIGSHAFYNCRKLEQIQVTDQIQSIDDGAFKNCSSLRYIDFRLYEGNFYAAKSILMELSQELWLILQEESSQLGQMADRKACRNVWDQAQAVLIFPRYLHDYEDNDAAKLIHPVTYGSGAHYRECIGGFGMDYRRYDELFRYSQSNDKEETAENLALWRLLCPWQLTGEAKTAYESYLQKQMTSLIRRALDQENMEILEQIGMLSLYQPDQMDLAIQTAHHMGRVEALAYLMGYKNEYLKPKEKCFEL